MAIECVYFLFPSRWPPQFAMENGGNIWRTVFFFNPWLFFDYRGYTWKLVGLLIYWLIECCWFGVFWVVLLTGKLDWRNRFGNLFCHVLSMDLGGCYIYIFQYGPVAQCLLLAEPNHGWCQLDVCSIKIGNYIKTHHGHIPLFNSVNFSHFLLMLHHVTSLKSLKLRRWSQITCCWDGSSTRLRAIGWWLVKFRSKSSVLRFSFYCEIAVYYI